MSGLLELPWNGDNGRYIWTAILIAIIMGISVPLAIYEQKVVKRRWKAVTAFVEGHVGQVKIRSLEQKEGRDILVPIYSGFLIHGNFTYICLDPLQDPQKALSFVERLRDVCITNNSWHFDISTNRLLMRRYYKQAQRAFGEPL